jgi:hypothetical protein
MQGIGHKLTKVILARAMPMSKVLPADPLNARDSAKRLHTLSFIIHPFPPAVPVAERSVRRRKRIPVIARRTTFIPPAGTRAGTAQRVVLTRNRRRVTKSPRRSQCRVEITTVAISTVLQPGDQGNPPANPAASTAFGGPPLATSLRIGVLGRPVAWWGLVQVRATGWGILRHRVQLYGTKARGREHDRLPDSQPSPGNLGRAWILGFGISLDFGFWILNFLIPPRPVTPPSTAFDGRPLRQGLGA